MRPFLTKDVFKCIVQVVLSSTEILLSNLHLERKQSCLAPYGVISVSGFLSLLQLCQKCLLLHSLHGSRTFYVQRNIISGRILWRERDPAGGKCWNNHFITGLKASIFYYFLEFAVLKYLQKEVPLEFKGESLPGGNDF